MLSHSFPPVARGDARVLILGTLPGPMSLQQQQYYAKPQNAFWRIMGALIGAGPDLPYDARLERVMAHRIALWDVCAAAVRPGALDAAIVGASIVPHDFAVFLAEHGQISRICFNGAKAGDIYRRLVLPGLPEQARTLDSVVLPSTSPAHAGRSFEQKLLIWRAALAQHQPAAATPR